MFPEAFRSNMPYEEKMQKVRSISFLRVWSKWQEKLRFVDQKVARPHPQHYHQFLPIKTYTSHTFSSECHDWMEPNLFQSTPGHELPNQQKKTTCIFFSKYEKESLHRIASSSYLSYLALVCGFAAILLCNSERIPPQERAMPDHPMPERGCPLRIIDKRTENILRVVVTVERIRGSKLAIV